MTKTIFYLMAPLCACLLVLCGPVGASLAVVIAFNAGWWGHDLWRKP